MDAKRRGRLVNDAADDLPVYGQPRSSGHGTSCFSNSSSWCSGGYGGPSKIFAGDTSVDGGGVRDVGHPYFDELYESVGLVLFTFLLGVGAVMNDPAWQAITPDVVSERHHASAVALNSAGFNVARSVGPALGGAVVAATGSGWAFLLNAVSFFGVIYFLYQWKRPHQPSDGRVRVHDAIIAGLRYVKGSILVKSVLIRTGAFSIAASSVLALLPVIARPHGARGYGLLLGSFGVGALVGAAVLPHVRERLSVDGLVAGAVVVFALMTFALGQVQQFGWLCLVMFVAGLAWIGILACLNVTAQTMCPSWMRARALSMYLLVLQGGMAIGSAAWGALASRYGVPDAMMGASIALIVGLSTVKRHRLTSHDLELAPAVVRD